MLHTFGAADRMGVLVAVHMCVCVLNIHSCESSSCVSYCKKSELAFLKISLLNSRILNNLE